MSRETGETSPKWGTVRDRIAESPRLTAWSISVSFAFHIVIFVMLDPTLEHFSRLEGTQAPAAIEVSIVSPAPAPTRPKVSVVESSVPDASQVTEEPLGESETPPKTGSGSETLQDPWQPLFGASNSPLQRVLEQVGCSTALPRPGEEAPDCLAFVDDRAVARLESRIAEAQETRALEAGWSMAVLEVPKDTADPERDMTRQAPAAEVFGPWPWEARR